MVNDQSLCDVAVYLRCCLVMWELKGVCVYLLLRKFGLKSGRD